MLALAVDGFKEKVNLMGDLKAVKATFQFVNPSQKKTSRVGFLPRVKLPWQSQGLTQPVPPHQTGITTHQLTYYIGQTIEEALRKITNWPFMKLRPNQRLLEKYTMSLITISTLILVLNFHVFAKDRGDVAVTSIPEELK